jgi:hypothetical protein
MKADTTILSQKPRDTVGDGTVSSKRKQVSLKSTSDWESYGNYLLRYQGM